MNERKQSKGDRFIVKCKDVEAATGISVGFVTDEQFQEPFEDDGALHICSAGVRAFFDVGNGQSLSGAEQNENTRKVMAALKLEKKIGDRVLVEDDEEDEDDCCPRCGRLW